MVRKFLAVYFVLAILAMLLATAILDTGETLNAVGIASLFTMFGVMVGKRLEQGLEKPHVLAIVSIIITFFLAPLVFRALDRL